MRKPFRFVSAGSLALVLTVSVGAAGCGKYSWGSLAANKHIKEAHELYKASKWKDAAQKYADAAASNPEIEGAYFFQANCYDNLYKPSRANEPENDAYIQKAIALYKEAAEKEKNQLLRKRAMEYLVAAYGADKLNQPDQAEPVVKRMIELEPTEHTNYFALSQIYENAGRYDEAEQALLKAKELKPSEPTVYSTLSAFYNRQGEFDKTVEALTTAADLQPQNPQGYYTVAVFFWEKAFKDKRLTNQQQKEYILRGIAATDKALSLNKDYIDALTYKNILLRMQANLETDRTKQQNLYREADELRNRSIELGKKKSTAGAQ
jgi:tetratricopeptide (TPR) repeat protein